MIRIVTTLQLNANGARFHAIAAGDPGAPLVLLLHGFPELSRSWRHQLPALAEHGFYAVAPDLRGYGRSDKHGPFDIRTLVRDVEALVGALGRNDAVIVGHDWGGAIAWMSAHLAPATVSRLAVLNCAHPLSFIETVWRSPRQLARSWYIAFFQLPFLPEWGLRRKNAEAVARILRYGSTVDSAWPEDEVRHYRSSFTSNDAARAAIDYYRAAARTLRTTRDEAKRNPITIPTLLVWGLDDPALGRDFATHASIARWCAPGHEARIVTIAGCGHFVQNELPERVNAELLSWLRDTDVSASEN